MFYLIYGIFYLLSLLPMWLLYGLSNLIYFLLYYVFGYRKKVVMNNLRLAFPEKSETELIKIAHAFYRNFVDNFIEMLKLFSASKSFIRKHFQFENIGLLETIAKKGVRCQVHLGHNFNWELANLAVPLLIDYPLISVYMPVGNKLLDRIFLRLRSRTGVIMIPATEMRKSILPYRDRGYMLALAADQAPGSPAKAYWLNFFGHPTPVVRGPERGARAADIPAVFAQIYKQKRGHYIAQLEIPIEHPAQVAEGELTRQYIHFLERVIRQHPEMWLWSHRRWKHVWKEEYKASWIDTAPLPNS
ncbi:MAG: lysophospholipid acyltransferase family protein [Chitinophagales bacterium]